MKAIREIINMAISLAFGFIMVNIIGFDPIIVYAMIGYCMIKCHNNDNKNG